MSQNVSGKTVNGVPLEEILTPSPMIPELVQRIAHRKVKRPDLEIVSSHPQWPEFFEGFKGRILAAFEAPGPHETGHLAEEKVDILAISHVGSTSVPRLPAKAVIDIDLILTDNTLSSEAFYVPRLEAAGFQFLLREPAWYEHRFFVASEPMSCNLHVFGPKCAEVERHRIFRDWLREHDDDRELYARTKVECAAKSVEHGEDIMAYTARKEGVIQEILARAFAALVSDAVQDGE